LQANLEFLKARTVGGAQLSVGSILEEGRGLRGVIAEFEKEAIRQAHARVGRSQHKIANLLKVSRGSLQHKLRKYQLESYAPAEADTEEEGAG
jgi:transcriptional regulator with PAS, ATPase and Fis domain